MSTASPTASRSKRTCCAGTGVDFTRVRNAENQVSKWTSNGENLPVASWTVQPVRVDNPLVTTLVRDYPA
ncbi:hypothetical protein GCM10009634_19960 [Saccharothrix xinjiangensis]